MKKLLLKTWLLLACLLLGVGTAWATEVTYTFGDVASDQSWANGVAYTNVTLDNFTFTVSGGGNNGKYYTSDETWRFYNGGGLTITPATGYTITEVTSNPAQTFAVSDGVASISFSETVKFKSITITYTTDGGGSTPTVTAPVFDVAAGTYYEDQLVLIDNYDSNYIYAYTTDGSNPAFNADLDVTNGTVYDEGEGIEITSSCTLKAIAIDEDGNTSSITSAAYVISYPQVFASLEELVAADLESGAIVKVSFENVPIKSIFTTTQGYRNGIYFDIQKDGKDIEIYYQNVPEAWEEGGVLSGTMTCPWKSYNGTWELAPVKDAWDWANLTYTARSITALTISGTPTKKDYYVGDAFDPAGLVVTATYNFGAPAVVTEDVEWTFDPETLALGTTSVDVKANVGNVVSNVYPVTGLTVTKPDFETATYEFSSFTSGTSVELTDLEGFIITLSKGEGNTNPAWVESASEARVYAGGTLSVKANNALIKQIEYTYTINANKNGNAPTIDSVEGTTYPGTWDEETNTWTGGDEEVVFSTSGTAGNIGFTKLVIKYVEGTKVKTTLAWSNTEAEVTIGAEDNEFPTLTTTPVDLTGVTYESSNTAVATIAADGTVTLVKAGETTITASYAGDEEHAAATPVSYTLTVNDAPFVPVPAEDGYESVDLAALYSSVTTNATVEDYEGTSFALTFAKPESSTNPTKYYDNGKAVRAYTGNTITITAAENIKNVFVDYVSGYYDDAATITGLDSKTAVITFSKTCRFYGITVNYTVNTIDLTAQEDDTYYATFSNNETVYFSNDAEVNTVNVKSGAMTLATVVNNIVPASTGVLLSTTSATASYYRAASHTESLSNNMLRPASEAMTGDYTFYKLAYGNWTDKTGLGFYYGAADGAAFTAKAGGAYLAVPAGAGARAGYAFNGDEADGLEAIELNEAATIYTLDGTQINELRKGLNIVNGKKIFVK